jgi:hypothetical protein
MFKPLINNHYINHYNNHYTTIIHYIILIINQNEFLFQGTPGMGHTASRGPKPSRSTAEADAARPKPDCGAVGKRSTGPWPPKKRRENVEKPGENVGKTWGKLGKT